MDATPHTGATGSLNLRLAQAYASIARIGPAAHIGPPTLSPTPATPQVQRANAVAASDRADIASTRFTPASAPSTGKANSKKLQSLVAAKVDAPPAFDAPPQAQSLKLYRHPADANAAATGVALGLRVDVQG